MMDRTVDISVIIPVYNAAKTVAATVESILGQKGCSFEVILVDDGSTDSSGSVCDLLAASDDRVRVLHQVNKGVSAARNAGIEAASGTYVMFSDSDDILKEGAFKALLHEDYDFIVGGFEKVFNDGKIEVYHPEMTDSFDGGGLFDALVNEKECYLLNSPCFKLFRRSVIEDGHVRFVEGLSYAEDKIFVQTFLCYADRCLTVHVVVYSYILRDASLSSDLVSDRHIAQIMILLEEYSALISRLSERYPNSTKVASLYHNDLISRYVCRVLTVFMLRKSAFMNVEVLNKLYEYMDGDRPLGLFSVRPGQILNVALYKIGSARISAAVYSFTSTIVGWFHKID